LRCARHDPASTLVDTEVTSVPAKTEKQRKFMGAELQRKREGKKTRTGMSESELEKMASKDGKKKS
jgi:hypothetical protein